MDRPLRSRDDGGSGVHSVVALRVAHVLPVILMTLAACGDGGPENLDPAPGTWAATLTESDGTKFSTFDRDTIVISEAGRLIR